MSRNKESASAADANAILAKYKISVTECDDVPAEERVYLSAVDLERWVRRYGATGLCRGPRGGIFVRLSDYKKLGGALQSSGEIDEDVALKRLEKKKVKVEFIESGKYDAEVYDILGQNYIVAKNFDIFSNVMQKKYSGNGKEIAAAMLRDMINRLYGMSEGDMFLSQDYSNVDIRNIHLIENGVKSFYGLMILSMPDELFNIMCKYAKTLKDNGSVSASVFTRDEQEYLYSIFNVKNWQLIDFSLKKFLFTGYSAFSRCDDVSNIRSNLGDDVWDVLSGLKSVMDIIKDDSFSLYNFGFFLSKFVMVRKSKGKTTTILKTDNIGNVWEDFFKFKKKGFLLVRVGDDLKNAVDGDKTFVETIVKPSFVIYGILRGAGVSSKSAWAVSKGVSVMAQRTYGNFNGIAPYLDWYLQKFVTGNGRPVRVPNKFSPGIGKLIKALDNFVTPMDLGIYLNFVRNYVKERHGEQVEVYRNLNLFEGSIFLANNIAKVADRVLFKDEKRGEKYLNALMKDGNVIKGYTLSTSVNRNDVEKFLQRGWTSGVLAKATIKSDSVVGGYFVAGGGYVDDSELTVEVSHDGIKFETVTIIPKRPLERGVLSLAGKAEKPELGDYVRDFMNSLILGISQVSYGNADYDEYIDAILGGLYVYHKVGEKLYGNEFIEKIKNEHLWNRVFEATIIGIGGNRTIIPSGSKGKYRPLSVLKWKDKLVRFYKDIGLNDVADIIEKVV